MCSATACSLWSAGTSPRIRVASGSGSAAGSVVDSSAGALSLPCPERAAPCLVHGGPVGSRPGDMGTVHGPATHPGWRCRVSPPGRNYPKPAKAGGPSIGQHPAMRHQAEDSGRSWERATTISPSSRRAARISWTGATVVRERTAPMAPLRSFDSTSPSLEASIHTGSPGRLKFSTFVRRVRSSVRALGGEGGVRSVESPTPPAGELKPEQHG